ncbi:hypothetical protein B8A15_07325, partial [Staphylococcus aureus]
LKGSYPNVDNEQDRAYYAEHPKEALWWVKGINQSYISTLKLVGSANFKVLFKLRTVISRNKVFVYT